MRKNAFCSVLLSICVSTATAQEANLKGTVILAEADTPVAGVVVSVQRANGDKVLAYGMTDENGHFSISLSGARDSLFLTASSMMTETAMVPVTSPEKNIIIRVREKKLALRESIIQAPKVTMRGDTLNYNVSSYSKSEDWNIGEVLKRIPGIKVASDGEIFYQNLQISKLYVEGLDLLQGRYGLATGNIDPSMVSTIRVLENHQPIRVLEDTEIPAQAAINLKLNQSALGVAACTDGLPAERPDLAESVLEEHPDSALAFIGSVTYDTMLTDHLLVDTVGQALQSHYSSVADNNEREAQLLGLQLLLVALGLSLMFFLVLWTMSHIRHKREREYDEILNCYIAANEALEASNEGMREQIDNLKQGNDELEKKLEMLRNSFVALYKEKFSVVGQLYDIYMASGTRPDRKDVIFRRVEHLIAYISADEKMHPHFEDMINNDLGGIVQRLKEDLGDIDGQYSRFICYCIAGFAPEMIGSILGMSVSNVYTKRSRLRERIKGLDSPYKEEYLRMI